MNEILLNALEEHFKSLNQVRNLTLSNDKLNEILEFLLEISEFKAEFKKRFFSKINNHLVFNKDDFLSFLNMRVLHKSYTKFSNHINLYSANVKLKNNDDVVLNFPFKDCVLKGGASKDESKSNEIFFNEILARDEIDVLKSPKVLCNFELIKNAAKRERERERAF